MEMPNFIRSLMLDAMDNHNMTISVHNGEYFGVKRSSDINAIIEECMSVDDCSLRFRDKTTSEVAGWIDLLWINDPEEAIHDYGVNPFIESLVDRWQP